MNAETDKGCSLCAKAVNPQKEKCAECCYAQVMKDLGYRGFFEEYEGLSNDIELMNCVGYLLKDTVYLYGNASETTL